MNKQTTERIEAIAPILNLKDGEARLLLVEDYFKKYLPDYWALLELDRQQRPYKNSATLRSQSLVSWLSKYDSAWRNAAAVVAEWRSQSWQELGRDTGLSSETARQIVQALRRGGWDK